MSAGAKHRRLLGLENTIRPYAWGSPTAIPALLGLEPTGEPVAEMWIGAHPGAPSRIFAEGTTLLDAVAKDPEQMLGPDVARERAGVLEVLVERDGGLQVLGDLGRLLRERSRREAHDQNTDGAEHVHSRVKLWVKELGPGFTVMVRSITFFEPGSMTLTV